MTSKAEALLDGLLDACIDSDKISAEYQVLVAYITELERKAAYHDRLMAMQTEEQTSEREPERNE